MIAIISFSSHAILSVVCAATMLLALWQGIRHRRNQRLALAMFIIGCYGGAGVLFRFQDLLDLSPAVVIYLSNTCYAVGMIALFDFLLEYTGVPVRLRRGMRTIGIILAVVLSSLMWAGFAFTDTTKTSDNAVAYNITPFGLMIIAIALIYQIVGIDFIRHTNSRHSRTLWRILAILPIEALLSVLPGIQGFPSDGIVLILVILVVAQLVIRDQILEPNLILNVQLARANAELIRANKRKSEFLAVISHELRTPLGAVISYTEMMLLNAYGPLNERQTEQLNKIGESGHYLLGMIGNVLDLSKVEAGQMRLNILPISVQERVSAVLKTVIPNTKERGGITVFCDISPDLPPVDADPQQFDKIMRSLLASSLAQLKVGTLTVRAEKEAKTIKITVSHTGAGFTPEQLAHLFDPTHANLPNESTQLELAIAAQLVRLHGGVLRAESEGVLGRGASFRFSLPLHIAVDVLPQQITTLTPEIAS